MLYCQHYADINGPSRTRAVDDLAWRSNSLNTFMIIFWSGQDWASEIIKRRDESIIRAPTLIESGTCDYCLDKNRYSKSYPDYSRVATSVAVTQVLILDITKYQNRIVVRGTSYKMCIL